MYYYLVVNMINPSNQFNIMVYQRTKFEYKIKTQIGFNSYSTDYVWGLYEVARSCFCYLINGYSLVTNNLGFEFGHAIHSGDFSELDKPEEEPPLIQPRCSQFRTAYEPIEDPIEPPPILTRTENAIIEPEKECPLKLAD